ncbi:MAG: hypothetical protein LBF60_08675, partial [Treponema sp.]|nr:hypothetical protein [Treponema sp.]
EVSKQLYYEKASQIDMLPARSGGPNGVAHERMKNGGTGNRRGRRKAGGKEKALTPDRYARLAGYNRKRAGRVLSTPSGKAATVVIDGKALFSNFNSRHSREQPILSVNEPPRPEGRGK